ncbi:MAG: helix-turn-helix domain-containing protein [Fimbriimonadaceae bacterium]|nr:helix-turn-helix domain-containing protein [Fimbriimonadaceae bacterium]
MSQSRQAADSGVLIRFWSLDHHRSEPILWPVSPWAKLVFAVEGAIQVETSQGLHILPANRALWVRAGEPHPGKTLGKARVRTLYFAPELEIDRENGPLEVRPFLRELITEICRVGPVILGQPFATAFATLIQHEAQTAPAIPTSIPMPQSEWLRTWADDFFRDPSVVPDAGTSRRTIERHIIKETSLTLGQWCQQARALIGLRCLATGSTVLEAATESGFETSSGFIQSFRKQFGTTPGKILRSRYPD